MKFYYCMDIFIRLREAGDMRQKLLLEKAPFVDHLTSVEEEDLDVMEDKLDDAAPWELAFERGVEQADNDMVSDWKDEDEFE